MKTPKTAGTILKFEQLQKKGRIILGIDPGLKSMGIGLIEITENLPLELKKMKKELIDPASLTQFITGYAQFIFQIKAARKTEEKLYFIFENLCKIIEEYDPVLILVEDAFVGINKGSALKLGLARGSILSAIGKYQKELRIISPKEIKRQVAKNGAAEKEELAIFFKQNFKDWQEIRHDATDALAAALCGVVDFLDKSYIK